MPVTETVAVAESGNQAVTCNDDDAAVAVEASVVLHLTNSNKPLYEQHLRDNLKYKDRVLAAHNSRHGKEVIICGAGPSLGSDAGLITTRKPDEVWGCNRALNWLAVNGYNPTHGIWVDPGDAWKDEWADLYDVHYYVSSSAKPGLLDHLDSHDARFSLFHNWVGIPKPTDDWTCPLPQHANWEYETYLYASLYPPTVCVGAGLNAVNRAVGLALYFGFRHITVIGADCATRSLSGAVPPEGEPGTAEYNIWLADQQMYPAGNAPALTATSTAEVYGEAASLLEGIIDGRPWACRPDMLISAINLVRLKQEHGHQLELVGDTLPNAMLGKNEEFMKLLPKLNENSAIEGLVPRGTALADLMASEPVSPVALDLVS